MGYRFVLPPMIHLRIVAPPELATRRTACARAPVRDQRRPHPRRRGADRAATCSSATSPAKTPASSLPSCASSASSSGHDLARDDLAPCPTRRGARSTSRSVRLPTRSSGRGRVQTSESAELSLSFLAFMLLATMIAALGIIHDSVILIIGAMVVGPEFGPLAGLCVALVQRQLTLAGRRSTPSRSVSRPGSAPLPARSPCARAGRPRTNWQRSPVPRPCSSRIRTILDPRRAPRGDRRRALAVDLEVGRPRRRARSR